MTATPHRELGRVRVVALSSLYVAVSLTYIVIVSFWVPLVFDTFLVGTARTSALSFSIVAGGVLQLLGPLIAEHATALLAMSYWIIGGTLLCIPTFAAIALAAYAPLWPAPVNNNPNATAAANATTFYNVAAPPCSGVECDSNSFLRSGRFWLVFGGYFGYQLFSTVAVQPYTGLVPMHIQPAQRGFASGAIGCTQLLGCVVASGIGVLLGSDAVGTWSLLGTLIGVNVVFAAVTVAGLRGVEQAKKKRKVRRCDMSLITTLVGPCCHTSEGPRQERQERRGVEDAMVPLLAVAAARTPASAASSASTAWVDRAPTRSLGRRFFCLWLTCALTTSAQQVTTFFLLYFFEDTVSFPIVFPMLPLVHMHTNLALNAPASAAAAWYLLQLATATLCAPLGGLIADASPPPRGAPSRRCHHACCGRRGAMSAAMLCALATPAFFIVALVEAWASKAASGAWILCVALGAVFSGAAQGLFVAPTWAMASDLSTAMSNSSRGGGGGGGSGERGSSSADGDAVGAATAEAAAAGEVEEDAAPSLFARDMSSFNLYTLTPQLVIAPLCGLLLQHLPRNQVSLAYGVVWCASAALVVLGFAALWLGVMEEIPYLVDEEEKEEGEGGNKEAEAAVRAHTYMRYANEARGRAASARCT